MHRVPFMANTGLQTLEGAILNLEARGIRIMCARRGERVREKFDKADILAAIEPEDHFG